MHFIVSCPVWEDASPRLEVSGAGTFSCICPRLEEVWFSASCACLCVRTASEVPGAPPSRDQLIVFPLGHCGLDHVPPAFDRRLVPAFHAVRELQAPALAAPAPHFVIR
ncbi:hypothetical protein CABS01_03773 [Colletotrichum abscissum]|uniref:Uncharacterized protein n=2 Tax=Colletotrichum acutatum species complex TaxID=2707335 RepID=A0AAI9UKB3_9PEZI|nr:uncharacterized protein CABS01_03773 [Colletotrichum abscissum]KAK1460024.1 hypothetical protein CMEL01_03023 [Colletotrichum melonis]KAK1475496.1 hypothetical protein CABS01_03773 [Colletotrichum abscissum]KAK1493071.1 hypothetical protein CCUS01_13893 [Colletotrichum cuscutae]